MPRTYEGELSPSVATLGMVCRWPGETVRTVAERLKEQFEWASFDPSTAYKALPEHAKWGRVRRINSPVGNSDSADDCYVPTAAGEVFVTDWVQKLPKRPIALREELYGRVALSKPSDLPFLISATRRRRKESEIAYTRARTFLSVLEMRDEDERGLETELDVLLTHNVAESWAEKIRALRRLQKDLETLARKSGVPVEGGLAGG